MNWISVEERLPPYYFDIIFCTIDKIVGTAFYEPITNVFKCDPRDEYFIPNITHWMPLPEPPKN